MDFLRLVPQILAAAFIAGFFLLAALVIFGTAIACLRTRQPSRKAAALRRGRPPARPASERVSAARV
jgi:hypothetical protein